MINAVEAINGAGGSISIKLSNPETNSVKVEITDSGGGIAADDISKIFEPYFSTKETGTGLGLAIVKKAIDSIPSDSVSCAMPVETPKSSFTAGMAGMNRCIDSGPMNVMETSAMKKYQRGRMGIEIIRKSRVLRVSNMLPVNIAVAAMMLAGTWDHSIYTILPTDSWIASQKVDYRSCK